MTPKEQAAMQQALEALEVYEIKLNSRLCNEAITALREALAEQQTERTQDAKRNVVGLANTRSSIRSTSEYSEQAEQEPVAWSDDIGAMPFNTYCKAIVNWGSRSNCGESYLEGNQVEVIVVKYGKTEGSAYTEPKPRFAFLHTGANQYLNTSVHVLKWKPL